MNFLLSAAKNMDTGKLMNAATEGLNKADTYAQKKLNLETKFKNVSNMINEKAKGMDSIPANIVRNNKYAKKPGDFTSRVASRVASGVGKYANSASKIPGMTANASFDNSITNGVSNRFAKKILSDLISETYENIEANLCAIFHDNREVIAEKVVEKILQEIDHISFRYHKHLSIVKDRVNAKEIPLDTMIFDKIYKDIHQKLIEEGDSDEKIIETYFKNYKIWNVREKIRNNPENVELNHHILKGGCRKGGGMPNMKGITNNLQNINSSEMINKGMSVLSNGANPMTSGIFNLGSKALGIETLPKKLIQVFNQVQGNLCHIFSEHRKIIVQKITDLILQKIQDHSKRFQIYINDIEAGKKEEEVNENMNSEDLKKNIFNKLYTNIHEKMNLEHMDQDKINTFLFRKYNNWNEKDILMKLEFEKSKYHHTKGGNLFESLKSLNVDVDQDISKKTDPIDEIIDSKKDFLEEENTINGISDSINKKLKIPFTEDQRNLIYDKLIFGFHNSRIFIFQLLNFMQKRFRESLLKDMRNVFEKKVTIEQLLIKYPWPKRKKEFMEYLVDDVFRPIGESKQPDYAKALKPPLSKEVKDASKFLKDKKKYKPILESIPELVNKLELHYSTRQAEYNYEKVIYSIVKKPSILIIQLLYSMNSKIRENLLTELFVNDPDIISYYPWPYKKDKMEIIVDDMKLSDLQYIHKLRNRKRGGGYENYIAIAQRKTRRKKRGNCKIKKRHGSGSVNKTYRKKN